MIIVWILIAVVVAVVFLICYDVNRFILRDYRIYTDKIDREYKIAFLADMHNKEFGQDNYKLIEAIREMKPDFICCAGDMITARPGHSYEPALNLFKYLKDYKVYYSIGNHEFRYKLYPEKYPDMYDTYLNKLREDGVVVLENDCAYVPDSNIRIQGLMIERQYYRRHGDVIMPDDYVTNIMEKADVIDGKAEDNRDYYNILLAHNPEYFETYCKSRAELCLSGHNHGGIVRLPFLGGLISPKLRLFPKYDGGLYNIEQKTMVLSRGLGSHTIPVRLFNPGELICIHLSPCQKTL